MAVAITGTFTENLPSGGGIRTRRTATFDASYTAGGAAVPAALLGLTTVRRARARVVTGFAFDFARVDVVAQRDGSLLLRVLGADGVEPATGAVTTGLAVEVTAVGV